jgi:bifunctional DNA-binding transcriptional regulator/antitoxin component of YhaV-PrlF toxin-antitoxin module
MNTSQSTISSKNQVVIPADIRKALGLKAGDTLNWQIIASTPSNKPKVIAEPSPQNWADYTRGLGEEVWHDIDIDTYIKNLRDEWQSQA